MCRQKQCVAWAIKQKSKAFVYMQARELATLWPRLTGARLTDDYQNLLEVNRHLKRLRRAADLQLAGWASGDSRRKAPALGLHELHKDAIRYPVELRSSRPQRAQTGLAVSRKKSPSAQTN